MFFSMSYRAGGAGTTGVLISQGMLQYRLLGEMAQSFAAVSHTVISDFIPYSLPCDIVPEMPHS